MPESKVSEQKRNKILEDFLCFENSELFLKYKITDRELFNILAHGYIDNDEKIDISEFYRQQENKRNKEDKMNEIERLSYDNRNSAKINYETVTAAEFIIKKLQFDMFIFSKEGVSMDESLYLFKNTRSDFEVLLANRMDGSGEVIDLPEYKTYLFDERGGQIIARRLDWFLRDQADTLFKGHFKCEEIRKNFSNAFVIMIHFEVLLSKSFNPNILIDHIFESKGYILGYQNNPYGNDFVNEKINEIRIGKISDTKNITKVEMNKRYNFVTECISKEIISLGKADYTEDPGDEITKTQKNKNLRKKIQNDKNYVADKIFDRVHTYVGQIKAIDIKSKYDFRVAEDIKVFIVDVIKNNKAIKKIYQETRFPQ